MHTTHWLNGHLRGKPGLDGTLPSLPPSVLEQYIWKEVTRVFNAPNANSRHPTNSVKSLKENLSKFKQQKIDQQ